LRPKTLMFEAAFEARRHRRCRRGRPVVAADDGRVESRRRPDEQS
jgi:hypothetical protein